MRRVSWALAVAMLLVAALPVTVAGADSTPATFTATATVTQQPGGTVNYVFDPTGAVPFPIPIAVLQTGEIFSGSINGCAGSQCRHLIGDSLAIVQSSTITIDGAVSPGVFRYQGPVNGTFTFERQNGKKVHVLRGSYAGQVEVTVNFLTFEISGVNTSQWQVTDTTGRFHAFEDASGSIEALIAGFFPGFETAALTINGTIHDDEDSDDDS